MKNDAKPLSAVLNQLLETYRLKSKVNEVNIVNSWQKVVGPLIASRTDKIYLKNGVLHITISSAPLKQELLYSKSQILDLLWKEFGKNVITDLAIH